MASGLSTTTRFGAIVLAIGVLGGVLAARSGQLLHEAMAVLAPAQLDQVAAMATRVAAGDLQAALAMLDPGLREAVAPLARQAFIGGFGAVLQTAGFAALLFAIVVGVLLSRPSIQLGTITQRSA